MKHIIYILSMLVISTAAFAQTRFDVTMNVDSVDRQFIVVRPSGAVPAGGYPIVFMFHGTSGDGEKFYNISGWKEKGEAEKFITVFPSSLEYCFINDSGKPTRTTKWNNGEAQEAKCPGVVLKDDIHFVRLMLDSIIKVFPIDRSRIYASGFSNGGCFVSKLAVEMSDVFAAVAAAAGPLFPLDSAAPRRYIPIAFIVGNMDHNIADRTSLTSLPMNDSCLLYLGSIIGRYLGSFSLAETYTKRTTPLTLSYLFNTPASSAPSTEFSCTLIDTLTHEYPNGKNHPIVAADQFWTFFRRFTLPAGVETPKSGESDVTVYPNPAVDYLMVSGEGDVTLTLRTVLGEQVFTRTTTGGRRIELPDLARGIYIADVSDARTRSARIIVLR